MKTSKGILLFLALCVIVAPAFSQGIFDKTANWAGSSDAAVNTTHVDGSVTFAGGVYTLEGNGNDIWDAADEGFFVYTEKSGSQTLTARVNWQDPGANEWSKVGVMIREVGDDAGSKTYYSILRGFDFGDRADAAWRMSTGGTSGSIQMFDDPPDNTLPVEATADGLWLRVTRIAEADIMVTEYSFEGNEWYVGNVTRNFPMAETVAYGLCITSHVDDDVLVSAAVDNVKLAAPTIQLVLANRTLPTSVLPEGGGKITGVNMEVQVVPSGSASATVTELLPPGVTATNIKASNGTASFANETITWKLTNASGTVNMTYDLDITAAAAATGYVLLDGQIDNQGDVSAVSGINSLFKVQWQVPFIDREATLDGVISAGEYDGAREETFGHADGDTTPPGVHISGTAYPVDEENVTFYIYHSRTSIYVALNVLDGDILDFDPDPVDSWQHDSAELYLDGNLSRDVAPKSGDRFGPQMTVLGDGSRNGGNDMPTAVEMPGGGHSTKDGAYWNYGAKVKDDNEYVVEYQLNKSQMLDPLDRTVIGFDILMNSGAGGGARSGKWGYNSTTLDGTAGEYWDDETGWAVIELVGGPTSVTEWYLH